MSTRILIDDGLARQGRSRLFEEARGEIRADAPQEVAGAIEALEAAVTAGAWAAGFFSYELGYLMEPRPRRLLPRRRDVPLLRFALFDRRRTLDTAGTDAWIDENCGGAATVSLPVLSMDRRTYEKRFAAVKRYIAAGDIYQINLTLKGRFDLTGCPISLYRDLRRKQPVAHGALLQFGDLTVLSLSPELFLEIRDGVATTRPMKGTAARGLTLDGDEALRRWLAADEKSRAENLMIVDLMRNDLGRVAETGSVRVTDLFTVETYRTLHQMTSGVRARLKPATGIAALLESLFPPGSVTGAPKLRAMEVIRELEDGPRGVYTGAVGYFAPGGGASFNVAIRTLTVDAEGQGEIGIGSGLVSDSEARDEYDECLLKMRFLTDPVREFELIETLRYDPASGYVLLDRHMERLERSARYFGFAFEPRAVRRALAEKASQFGSRHMRVRLLLSRGGGASVTSVPMTMPADGRKMRYALSPHGVESSNVFLYHKTTVRDFYDREHARMAAELGADEVLFVNERGELTEGSRTNVFILRGDRLVTPPVTSGLLAGTLRAELLARGETEEAVLTPADLQRAEAVYLGNSVRGLVPAEALEAAAPALSRAAG